jgi:ribosomal protein S27E
MFAFYFPYYFAPDDDNLYQNTRGDKMHIRCTNCGANTNISTNAKGAILRDLTWYDAENAEVRCPKCKNNILPIVASGSVGEDGTLPVQLDINRPIQKQVRTENTTKA